MPDTSDDISKRDLWNKLDELTSQADKKQPSEADYVGVPTRAKLQPMQLGDPTMAAPSNVSTAPAVNPNAELYRNAASVGVTPGVSTAPQSANPNAELYRNAASVGVTPGVSTAPQSATNNQQVLQAPAPQLGAPGSPGNPVDIDAWTPPTSAPGSPGNPVDIDAWTPPTSAPASAAASPTAPIPDTSEFRDQNPQDRFPPGTPAPPGSPQYLRDYLQSNDYKANLARSQAYDINEANTREQQQFGLLNANNEQRTQAYKDLEATYAPLAKEDHDRTMAAYQEYKAKAGTLQDPKNQYFDDNGGFLGRIKSGLAAFASGMSQGLIGKGGNPYLDYLNKQISDNFEAHKKNIQDLYEKEVAAGNIEDTDRNRHVFDQNQQLKFYDLSAAGIKDVLLGIGQSAQNKTAANLALKTAADIDQDSSAKTGAYVSFVAQQALDAQLRDEANDKERREAVAKAVEATMGAGGATPEKLNAAIAKIPYAAPSARFALPATAVPANPGLTPHHGGVASPAQQGQRADTQGNPTDLGVSQGAATPLPAGGPRTGTAAASVPVGQAATLKPAAPAAMPAATTPPEDKTHPTSGLPPHLENNQLVFPTTTPDGGNYLKAEELRALSDEAHSRLVVDPQDGKRYLVDNKDTAADDNLSLRGQAALQKDIAELDHIITKYENGELGTQDLATWRVLATDITNKYNETYGVKRQVGVGEGQRMEADTTALIPQPPTAAQHEGAWGKADAWHANEMGKLPTGTIPGTNMKIGFQSPEKARAGIDALTKSVKNEHDTFIRQINPDAATAEGPPPPRTK